MGSVAVFCIGQGGWVNKHISLKLPKLQKYLSLSHPHCVLICIFISFVLSVGLVADILQLFLILIFVVLISGLKIREKVVFVPYFLKNVANIVFFGWSLYITLAWTVSKKWAVYPYFSLVWWRFIGVFNCHDFWLQIKSVKICGILL